MNPVTHLYYRNLSQKLELQLESLQVLHIQALNNLLEAKKVKKNHSKKGNSDSPKKEKEPKFPKHDPNDPEIERLRYGPVD
jgi:hypothetical protein